MNKDKRIILLRTGYCAGAVFDGLMPIPMLWPRVGGLAFNIAEFHPGSDYRYAMGLAASLMAGWVCLLLWADRRPVERCGVLLLTCVPVLAGLIISGAYAVSSGFIQTGSMLPVWILQALLLLLFASGYATARKMN